MSMEELGIPNPDWGKLRRVMEALPAFAGPELFAEWFEEAGDDDPDWKWLLGWAIDLIGKEMWETNPDALVNFLCGFFMGASIQHIADS